MDDHHFRCDRRRRGPYRPAAGRRPGRGRRPHDRAGTSRPRVEPDPRVRRTRPHDGGAGRPRPGRRARHHRRPPGRHAAVPQRRRVPEGPAEPVPVPARHAAVQHRAAARAPRPRARRGVPHRRRGDRPDPGRRRRRRAPGGRRQPPGVVRRGGGRGAQRGPHRARHRLPGPGGAALDRARGREAGAAVRGDADRERRRRLLRLRGPVRRRLVPGVRLGPDQAGLRRRPGRVQRGGGRGPARARRRPRDARPALAVAVPQRRAAGAELPLRPGLPGRRRRALPLTGRRPGYEHRPAGRRQPELEARRRGARLGPGLAAGQLPGRAPPGRHRRAARQRRHHPARDDPLRRRPRDPRRDRQPADAHPRDPAPRHRDAVRRRLRLPGPPRRARVRRQADRRRTAGRRRPALRGAAQRPVRAAHRRAVRRRRPRGPARRGDARRADAAHARPPRRLRRVGRRRDRPGTTCRRAADRTVRLARREAALAPLRYRRTEEFIWTARGVQPCRPGSAATAGTARLEADVFTIRRALTAATVTGGVASLLLGGLAPAQAAHDETYSIAVIGDVPYGGMLIEHFPAFIGQINADPDVRSVTHLGDIKNGSSLCTDDYFALIRGDFDLFRDPLVYTPGDNEWTDCHRANNGAYNPLERLDKIRDVFFDQPGRTLGQQQVAVTAQAGYPENVRYTRNGISFAAVNMPGSNNSTLPWSGLGYTEPTPEQLQEVNGRTAADIALIHDTFARATADGNRAVVLQIQADMFDPTVTTPSWSDYSAFKPIVQAIVDESAAFGRPVYLLNGDSHVYNVDTPLATGSSWLSFYGVTGSANNLTRVTVNGSSLGEKGWLKITTHSTGTPLTWETIPAT